MNKWVKIVLISLLLLVLGLPGVKAEETPYQLSKPRTYQIAYQVQVENRGGVALNYKLKISNFMTKNLPPYQRLVSFKAPAGVKFNQTDHEQIITYQVARLRTKQTLKLEFNYTLVNYAIKYQLNSISGVSKVAPEYLQSETGIEVNDKLLQEVARKVTAKSSTSLEKAKQLFRYVNQNLIYQEQKDTKLHSAKKTLLAKRGICEDYSLLYIALCRAVGIPARFVSGFRFEPLQIGSNPTDLARYAHAWVEINLPRVGWVTVDPTFAYTINGVKEVNYDYFGGISKQDRHLFVNYSRQKTSSTWEYRQYNPARILITTKILIREI